MGDSASYDSPSPAEEARTALIQDLVANNHQIFSDWLSARNADKPMDIPDTVLHAFIPGRLYELADNPQNVDVIVNEREDSMVDFLIVEHTSTSVSDRNAWANYAQRIEEESKRSHHEDMDILILPPIPSGVDKMQWDARALIATGRMSFTDKPLLNVKLSDFDLSKHDLYVARYDDREELRGRGVGKAFYENLSGLARDMGYRFLSGGNNNVNLSFFIDTLGRVPYTKIKPEWWDFFNIKPENRGNDLNTVQFLYPEDRAKFVLE